MKNRQRTQPAKVCHLTSVHPPFDVRIFHKEAKTLARAGYTVVLIAGDSPEGKTLEELKIISLPEPKNRFQRMTKTVYHLFRLALKEKADVYHFHDPELIPVGLMFKVLGKKVIYDVHEDVFENILVKKWTGSTAIRKIISVLFRGLEKFGCVFFDRVITVTSAIAEKFPARKTIVLRNFPAVEMIDKSNFTEQVHKRKPAIIYTGGLSKNRGIGEIIQAMEFVGEKAELWILGKWESKEFRNHCESLKGWKYTKYLGIVPLDKVYEYMKVADVGISILYPIKNFITSLPIKAFEYMACSLPMVMSNFPYWQEIFGECALFVNPYDAEDIAGKILHLLDNSNEAKKLGDKGRELVEKEYNWELESKKLVQLYRGAV
jgi:glycosyltransferase involved in cell wall biosynthesis